MKNKLSLSKLIGLRLKKYREEHLYSQNELADILRIKPSIVAKYETKGIKNIDCIMEINTVLGINLLEGATERCLLGKTEDASITQTIQKLKNGSFVAIDLNGHMLKKKGKELEKDGYEIKILNLKDPRNSHRYNPFEYLKTDSDVISLTREIMKSTCQKSGDQFWKNAEEVLLQALVFYLKDYPDIPKEYKNFTNVMKLLRVANEKNCYWDEKIPLDERFAKFERMNSDSLATRYYKTFEIGTGKTKQSILHSLATRLNSFNFPDLELLTGSSDEMDLFGIQESKTAIFIVTAEDDRYDFLKQLFMMQLRNIVEGNLNDDIAQFIKRDDLDE